MHHQRQPEVTSRASIQGSCAQSKRKHMLVIVIDTVLTHAADVDLAAMADCQYDWSTCNHVIPHVTWRSSGQANICTCF